jgi:hypothetical protein
MIKIVCYHLYKVIYSKRFRKKHTHVTFLTRAVRGSSVVALNIIHVYADKKFQAPSLIAVQLKTLSEPQVTQLLSAKAQLERSFSVYHPTV